MTDYKNVGSYINDQTGKDLKMGELITSLSVTNTINGVNAIIVLSQTTGVDSLLVDAYGYGKTAIREGIKLVTEGSDEFAAMIYYHTKVRSFSNPHP